MGTKEGFLCTDGDVGIDTAFLVSWWGAWVVLEEDEWLWNLGKALPVMGGGTAGPPDTEVGLCTDSWPSLGAPVVLVPEISEEVEVVDETLWMLEGGGNLIRLRPAGRLTEGERGELSLALETELAWLGGSETGVETGWGKAIGVVEGGGADADVSRG